jgi:outer membrane protein
MASSSGGFAAGAFVSYHQGALRLNTNVVHGISGDLDGYRVQMRLSLHGRASARLLYAVGPSLAWTNGDWANTYFGISAEDAKRSGRQRGFRIAPA